MPAEGRPGAVPVWPLTEPSGREAQLWAELWARPQAVMWEQLGQELEVALFVRTLAAAEQPDASTERVKLARQYLDSLGLSVQGMLRNRWKIAPGEVEPEREWPVAEAPRRRSARDRLKVVPSDGGA